MRARVAISRNTQAGVQHRGSKVAYLTVFLSQLLWTESVPETVTDSSTQSLIGLHVHEAQEHVTGYVAAM